LEEEVVEEEAPFDVVEKAEAVVGVAFAATKSHFVVRSRRQDDRRY
jgi:hypothetical protein